MKDIDMKVQEVQSVPNKMDAKRPTPRHIIIKRPKVKERLLEARDKKLVTGGCQMGGEKGRMGEDGKGLKSTNW